MVRIIEKYFAKLNEKTISHTDTLTHSQPEIDTQTHTHSHTHKATHKHTHKTPTYTHSHRDPNIFGDDNH